MNHSFSTLHRSSQKTYRRMCCLGITLICAAFLELFLPALSQNAASDSTPGNVPANNPSSPTIIQSAPGGSQSSGSAQAGFGFARAEPATVVNPTHPNRRGQAMSELKPGEASSDETARVAAAGFSGNPRKDLAEYTNKLSHRSESPMLSSGQILFIDDRALAKVFPQKLFYVLRFRVWPLAFSVPPPLRFNNIFVFDKGEKMTLITDSDQLKALFQKAVQAADDDSQKLVTTAWLRLRQELVQDGMFSFSIGEIANETGVNAKIASGSLKVDPRGGNSGELTAKLFFGATGRLDHVEETNSIRSGMRPICQSTKLLDPDPIVRKMAEQDLLIMGRSAKEYLDEQRAKVSPALQKAIDDIWARILMENR